MMRRTLVCFAAIAALAACEPEVPDSASGVGFKDYQRYEAEQKAKLARERQAREAQLSSSVTVQPPTETGAPTPAQAQNAPVLTVQAPATTPAAPLSATRDTGETQVARTSGISDEQDFQAVSQRETIESNAERIARQREQYQQVAPADLPQRAGQSGPNIVAYALQSRNAPGEQIYSRGFGSANRAARNCAGYSSPDKAQQAFLEFGGPQRDRKGLDPDGDGFACSWDPRPFRKAVQG